MLVNKLKAGIGVALVLAICLGSVGAPGGLGQENPTNKAAPQAKKAEPKATAEKKMLEHLQGTWTCVYLHQNGVSSKAEMALSVGGNSLLL